MVSSCGSTRWQIKWSVRSKEVQGPIPEEYSSNWRCTDGPVEIQPVPEAYKDHKVKHHCNNGDTECQFVVDLGRWVIRPKRIGNAGRGIGERFVGRFVSLITFMNTMC